MGWAARFMRMHAPIVLYVPPHLVQTFKALRGDHGPLTVIPTEFEDTPAWTLYASQWRHHHSKDREAAYHTPELYAVWANKAFFVADTIQRNPYNTSHFYWCDVGAFRSTDPHPNFPLTSRFLELPEDRLLMNSVQPLATQDIQRYPDGIVGNFEHVDRVVGGLWGGSKTACLRFAAAYEAQLLRYFNTNRFAGKDQSVFLSAILEDPTLAYILDPSKQPTWDRWFFQQPLLANPDVPLHLDPSYPTTIHQQPIVTVDLMGGLGNQMFQVAAAFAHAVKHNAKLVLDGRPTLYWDTVFHRFQHFLSVSAKQIKQQSLTWREQTPATYSDPPTPPSNPPTPPPNGLYLNGYFQSHRYFSDCASLVRDMLKPSVSLVRRIRDKYAHLLDPLVRDKVVVVHACRGDYLAATNYRGNLPVSYYARAVSEIQTRLQPSLGVNAPNAPNTPIHYLLYGEDPLFWLEILPLLRGEASHGEVATFEILSPTETDDVECLALLQQFRNVIIANSSYSWWSAFLAGSEATVVAPSAEDVYPPWWIKV